MKTSVRRVDQARTSGRPSSAGEGKPPPGRRRGVSTERAVAWSVMAAVAIFVLWQLHPSLVFRNTTPADGDLAGHMHVARHLHDHLLPDWQVGGWSQDWFTGYPSLVFYFPLASLLVALVGFVLPFNIALKLLVAAGPVALPLCAYAFGRLNRCDRLTSACFGMAVLPLLLQPTIFFFGGSLEASAGGEYAYGLSLALGLLVVGLARAGLRTGGRRALTAGLLGAALLLHVVPTVMVVVAIAVATAMRPVLARLRWTMPVLAVGGLLGGFWVVPFVLRTHFTSGIEYPKTAPVPEWLFPVEMIPVLVLAALGSLVAWPGEPDKEADLKPFLVAMVAVSGLVFALLPGGRLFNGRFLPVWFLWLCLLGGYGLARVAQALDWYRQRQARGRPLERPMVARLVVPLVVPAVLFVLFDSRGWDGMLTRSSAVDASTTVRTRFGGLERSNAAYREYVDTVREVAGEHGCGRVHVEIGYGTWSSNILPLMWLTPRWTDGCLTTTQGYFGEASPTSPYIDRVNSSLSSSPKTADDTGTFDVPAGLAGLRSLGVRYFVATTVKTAQAADALPDLRAVAETKSYGDTFWKFYELADVAVVEPLQSLPVVVPGIGDSRKSWEDAVDRWYDAGHADGVVAAASGPKAWPRRDDVSDALPRQATGTSATVGRVRVDRDRVSFDVSRTGVPVLVKVSHFPNWGASGADGPWRVAPNQMVVVPTARTVELRYGRTGVDLLGWAATLVGIAALVVLARRGPVDLPADDHSTRERPVPRAGTTGGKAGKRRR